MSVIRATALFVDRRRITDWTVSSPGITFMATDLGGDRCRVRLRHKDADGNFERDDVFDVSLTERDELAARCAASGGTLLIRQVENEVVAACIGSADPFLVVLREPR